MPPMPSLSLKPTRKAVTAYYDSPAKCASPGIKHETASLDAFCGIATTKVVALKTRMSQIRLPTLQGRNIIDQAEGLGSVRPSSFLALRGRPCLPNWRNDRRQLTEKRKG